MTQSRGGLRKMSISGARPPQARQRSRNRAVSTSIGRGNIRARSAPLAIKLWPHRPQLILALAWNLANNLGLRHSRTSSDLVKAYEKLDPLAVLPVHTELVEAELAEKADVE